MPFGKNSPRRECWRRLARRRRRCTASCLADRSFSLPFVLLSCGCHFTEKKCRLHLDQRNGPMKGVVRPWQAVGVAVRGRERRDCDRLARPRDVKLGMRVKIETLDSQVGETL